MDISSYISVYSSGLGMTDSIAQVKGLGSAQTNATGNISSKGDTVNISEEARALFAEKTRMLDTRQDEAIDSMSLDSQGTPLGKTIIAESAIAGSEESSEKEEEGGGGADGSGSSSSTDEQKIKELESQLKELSSQLVSIMSGSGEPDEKQSQAAPIQQKMSVVQQQLLNLMSQMKS